HAANRTGNETVFQIISSLTVLVGVSIAYYVYRRQPWLATKIRQKPFWKTIYQFLYAGWGFDVMYDRLLVRPIVFLAHLDKEDFIDQFYLGLAAVSRSLNRMLSLTQTGRLRWYLAGIVVGAIISFTLMMIT
ncbi:MAG TPA: hypothetical protein VKA27_02520, partial [Sunxiuqinia sp.]|nr:hypothetical protein [Sunxiuqinia sp.]